MGRHLICTTECQDILQRVTAGESHEAVAISYDVSAATVRRHVKAHAAGKPFMPSANLHRCTERCALLTQAYESGQSLEAVGLAHHLTRERVRQILTRHGVTMRAPGGRRGGRGHHCGDVCAAILAEPGEIAVRAIARRLGVSQPWVSQLCKLHERPVARPSHTRHTCRERCHVLLAALAANPDARLYPLARSVQVPYGWVAQIFLSHHPEYVPSQRRQIERGGRADDPAPGGPEHRTTTPQRIPQPGRDALHAT